MLSHQAASACLGVREAARVDEEGTPKEPGRTLVEFDCDTVALGSQPDGSFISPHDVVLARRIKFQVALIATNKEQIDKCTKARDVSQKALVAANGEDFLQELAADPLWAQPGTADFESKYITTQKKPVVRELAGHLRELARLRVEGAKLERDWRTMEEDRGNNSKVRCQNDC